MRGAIFAWCVCGGGVGGGEDAGSFTDLLTPAIKLPGQSVYLTWVSLT